MQLPILIIKPDNSRMLVSAPIQFKSEIVYEVTKTEIVEIPNENYVDPTHDIDIPDETDNEAETTTTDDDSSLEDETDTDPEIDTTSRVFYVPVTKTEIVTDEITHPDSAWHHYTDEDFAEKCPGWEFYSIDFSVNVPDGKIANLTHVDLWEVDAETKVATATYTFSDDPNAVSLQQVKDALTVEVDNQAENARLKFLTPGAGQALEYERTLSEARIAHATEGELDPAQFPWLAAELNAVKAAGNDTYTLRNVVDDVLFQAEQWNVLGAAIKEKRRGAKLRIDAATTKEEVQAVLPIDWFEGIPL